MTETHLSETDLVVEFVGCHQRAARGGIGLSRNHVGARFAGDAFVAQITRSHRLADQRHGLEQEFDDGIAWPLCERLRPVDDLGAGIGQVRQDCRHRATVPRLGIEHGQTDELFRVELFCSCLLSALVDPGEQHCGENPAPFDITKSSDWCAGWNGGVHLDNPTCSSNGSGGGIPLPLVFERGQGDLPDAEFFSHDAHPGRSMGGAELEGAAADGEPPPLNGGGCSTGCHSFRSGVITPARTFLSGQFPLPSFLALPFSMPILAMKVIPSNCLRLTVRAARACGLTSSGLSPSAESRIALSVPRLMPMDLACPEVVPSRIQFSQNLRPLNGPSVTANSQSNISQLPSLLRLSMPSSPALPARICRTTVAIVP